MNIVLSSAGRRCGLVRIFRELLDGLPGEGSLIAVDASRLAAAGFVADRFELVPPCSRAEFVPYMVDLCARHDVDVVVPTIDAELPVYAAHQEEFARVGTRVLTSSPEAVDIASDKIRTAAWMVENDLPSPRTARLGDVLADTSGWTLPVVVKPRGGSSSHGVVRLDAWDRLEELSARADMMVQELAGGTEYTVDAWVDRNGRCRCAVPRRRIEVRGGEVQKAVTVSWSALESLVVRVVEALPGAFGPLNVQVFATGDVFRIIEINPRFGGGYPLTDRAGANFARWAIEETAGMPSTATSDGWRSGVVMLRYDDAVFADADDVGL